MKNGVTPGNDNHSYTFLFLHASLEKASHTIVFSVLFPDEIEQGT